MAFLVELHEGLLLDVLIHELVVLQGAHAAQRALRLVAPHLAVQRAAYHVVAASVLTVVSPEQRADGGLERVLVHHLPGFLVPNLQLSVGPPDADLLSSVPCKVKRAERRDPVLALDPPLALPAFVHPHRAVLERVPEPRAGEVSQAHHLLRLGHLADGVVVCKHPDLVVVGPDQQLVGTVAGDVRQGHRAYVVASHSPEAFLSVGVVPRDVAATAHDRERLLVVRANSPAHHRVHPVGHLLEEDVAVLLDVVRHHVRVCSHQKNIAADVRVQSPARHRRDVLVDVQVPHLGRVLFISPAVGIVHEDLAPARGARQARVLPVELAHGGQTLQDLVIQLYPEGRNQRHLRAAPVPLLRAECSDRGLFERTPHTLFIGTQEEWS